jgi:preprotein translocase subunit YajC
VQFLIIMVLLLVVMYVLMIRPQRQRQQSQQSMIQAAGIGDEILTTGGIYGTITEVEGDEMVVEIAEGLEVHMTRRGIAAVLPPESEDESDVIDTDATDADASEEHDHEAEGDEAAVTHGEEAVTGEGSAGPVAGDPR